MAGTHISCSGWSSRNVWPVSGSYHGVFVRDLDGDNVEALCHGVFASDADGN